MEIKNDFGQALKALRTLKGLSQEDFSLVSSRTYISSLERGLKSPTLEKIDVIAEVLGVHPLTVLVLAYTDGSDINNVSDTLNSVKSGFKKLN